MLLDSPLLKNLGGYIDGKWSQADSGKTMPVINPATSETIAIVPVMGRAETVRAVEAAARSLASPTSIEQRRVWLSQLADLITEHRQELGRIVTHEHGKPWKEAQGEAEYAASFFRFYSTCIDHLKPRQLPDRPRGHSWTVHYRPAGVAALVTPWNFPLAMLAKKFSAALAADCGCVIKPSSKTPLSMIALFTLMEQLKLPAGKANLVLGPAGEISDVLCEHPAVRVISFTGSTPVGKKLMAATAPHLKRLSLELGGNAPFIVFDDADIDKAVEHLMANKFRGAGQTCVCANRVYVQAAIADAFAEKLAARASGLNVGNGMDEGTDMGPLIDRNAFEKVKRHVDDAIARGANASRAPIQKTDRRALATSFRLPYYAVSRRAWSVSKTRHSVPWHRSSSLRTKQKSSQRPTRRNTAWLRTYLPATTLAPNASSRVSVSATLVTTPVPARQPRHPSAA